MNESCKIKLIKNLEVTELDGEKVMIDFSSGKYFLLKGAANEIWDYIQSPITISDIIQRLMNTYDVAEETCRESTFSFLSQLKNYGFISVD
jgi:hypothetical protein